ncbi:MAG: BLUF domain-containing protein [Oligoflexia bacterium]|nr:BLUF domain-containing protein [Oligoflexia bacterium]
MYQLVYLSFASKSFLADDPESGVDSILQVARVKNKDLGITGMLLFNGVVFIQMLEGDKEEVEKLYAKIEEDPRHSKAKVLIRQNSKFGERYFEDWTMGYRKVEKKDIKLIETLVPWQDVSEVSQKDVIIPKLNLMELFKQFRYGA